MTIDGTLTETDDGWYHFEAERTDIKIRQTAEGVEFNDLEVLVDLAGLDDDSQIPGAGELMESAVRALAEELHGDAVPWEGVGWGDTDE